MQPAKAWIASILSICVLSYAADNTQGLNVHPVLTHIFSASVQLGKLITPIPAEPAAGILSGMLLLMCHTRGDNVLTLLCTVIPIIGGKINGSALNGTIGTGGLATPIFSENGTVDNQNVQLYGSTDDKVPWYAECGSIGQPTTKFARCVSLATVCICFGR